MITAHNKKTGVTKEFSVLEWDLMSHWPNNDWSKISAPAPKDATKAAKKAAEEKKAADDLAALEDEKAKAALAVGTIVDDNNPPVL